MKKLVICWLAVVVIAAIYAAVKVSRKTEVQTAPPSSVMEVTFDKAVYALSPDNGIPGARLQTVVGYLGRPDSEEWVPVNNTALHKLVYHYTLKDGPAIVVFHDGETVDYLKRERP